MTEALFDPEEWFLDDGPSAAVGDVDEHPYVFDDPVVRRRLKLAAMVVALFVAVVVFGLLIEWLQVGRFEADAPAVQETVGQEFNEPSSGSETGLLTMMVGFLLVTAAAGYIGTKATRIGK